MQEYYKILGVNEDASDEAVEIAYLNLKEKYSKERFLEGEIGNEAAKNLTKIETAYNEIKAFRNENAEKKNSDELFAKVEKSIKEGNLAEAQNVLDNFSVRNAEWHYLQSVVFYKKNWINESRKQLEIAVQMDSDNVKYQTALDKLKKNMEHNERKFHQAHPEGEGKEVNNAQMGGTNDCCSFCATWCLMDMLCSCCCR